MDEGKKERFLSHLSDFISLCKKNRSNLKKILDKIRQQIANKRGPEHISRTLQIAEDTKIHLTKGFEDLEELFRAHDELLSHIGPLRSTKYDTLNSFTSFERDLQDWINFEFKEKGIDLTKEFQEFQQKINYFRNHFDDIKTRMTENATH